MADFGSTRTTNAPQRPRADHSRVIRGVPFQGPAEEPCPAPIPAREFKPELSDIYPTGPWELVSFMTGNADDGFGGAQAMWVHATYRERCALGKYQTSQARDQFGG